MSTVLQQPTLTAPFQIVGNLLRPAAIEQAAAKVGIFGRQGSGKTLTSALIALGLSKTYHNSAPVAFMDTENGSDYLKPIFDTEGVPLLIYKTRAFTDMKQGLKDAQGSGCCANLIDSYTHPWRELNDALKKKLKVSKLTFQHSDQLLGMWQEWTDQFLNSPLHVIVSGRLGYDWDREDDEETGKKGDLIKMGTKMKSQAEAGYEPSLLIEMEQLQDADGRQKSSRSKKGSITHYAYVLKDRWRTLNGRTFNWKDMNEYKQGDYAAVFNTFLPHFSKLAIGKEQKAVNSGRTSAAMFDGQGQGEYFKQLQDKQIACEEIEGLLGKKIWSGMDANSKALKALAVETLFHTHSWTKVTTLPLSELEFALEVVRAFARHIEGEKHDAKTDTAAAAALFEMCKADVAADRAAVANNMDLVPV